MTTPSMSILSNLMSGNAILIYEDASLPSHVTWRWAAVTQSGKRSWFPSEDAANVWLTRNWSK